MSVGQMIINTSQSLLCELIRANDNGVIQGKIMSEGITIQNKAQQEEKYKNRFVGKFFQDVVFCKSIKLYSILKYRDKIKRINFDG